MSDTIKIRLTNRPPIVITAEDWPVIAEASDTDYDNEDECRANRISKWHVKVRQHADGRVIVYAGYKHTSNWQTERDYEMYGGHISQERMSTAAIVQTIVDICGDMAHTECASDDHTRWDTLARACISNMPEEVVE